MNKPPSDQEIKGMFPSYWSKTDTAIHIRDQWKAANEEIVKELEFIRFHILDNQYQQTSENDLAKQELDRLIEQLKP